MEPAIVEQAFAGVKRLQIVRSKIRFKSYEMKNHMVRIVAGLHNLSWNYLIGSLSLDYELSTDGAFSPMVIYHYQKDFDEQFEGGMRAQYQSKYYLGRLYRQNVRLTILAGMDLSEKLGLH